MNSESIRNPEISFRDRLSVLGEKGKRIWVYSKKPKGILYTWRNIVGYLLTAFFFAAPHIKINNEPMILINLLERKFVLFGAIFWPQDSYLFFLGFISMFVFIILFTVVYGRMWCGWACPQTVFTELIYRRIEYLIEGDHNQQKRLKEQSWGFEKIWKKTVKHSIFWLIAFMITNTLLSYLIGFDSVWKIASETILEHKTGFIAMLIFTTFLYLIYSLIRELACIIICPYGRLQSVLLDSNSIVVAYDYKRGEPRFHYNPLENRKTTSKGDCVDCTSCVLVCPTNIDIRNGTQLECINCTACIDACNQVMKRVNLPTGLIRFASSKQISEGKKFEFTPRIMLYTAVLTGLLVFLTFLLSTRENVETTILRTSGLMYQEQPNNQISNLYNIKVVNKTFNDLPIEVKLLSHKGEIKFVGNSLLVKGDKAAESVFFVFLKNEDIKSAQTQIELGIFSSGKLIEKVPINFVGPKNTN